MNSLAYALCDAQPPHQTDSKPGPNTHNQMQLEALTFGPIILNSSTSKHHLDGDQHTDNPGTVMLWLSEIMLENHDINTFSQLEGKVRDKAASGELFFRMDVKPTYPDTPDNWEDRLEAVFTSVLDNKR